MNPKHARLLRQARTAYISKMIDATPDKMIANNSEITRGADALCDMLLRVWPGLTHRGRGATTKLLVQSADTGTFNLSDACARLIRA